MSQLNLVSFLARGFSEESDSFIANIPVEGIDKYHTYSQIRLAPETSEYLYRDYTPLQIKYFKGSRPRLEQIINDMNFKDSDSDQARILKILQWTAYTIKHAQYANCETPGNRALSEEELLASGWGWCNEKARIFVSLAQIAGFPARMCSLFHADKIHGHMTAEVYVDNKWSFVDPTSATVVSLPHEKTWRSAQELSWDKNLRDAIDDAYRESAIKVCKMHGDGKSYIDDIWYSDNPYKMFSQIGITNYSIFSFPI